MRAAQKQFRQCSLIAAGFAPFHLEVRLQPMHFLIRLDLPGKALMTDHPLHRHRQDQGWYSQQAGMENMATHPCAEHITVRSEQVQMPPDEQRIAVGAGPHHLESVSYTHLTLPTICSV